MFGLVTASAQELSEEQKQRYTAVYCGICRAIGQSDGGLCRLGLRYDMAFLALVLMSLYEPEETGGSNACLLHPVKKRPWVDNEYIRYAARMNVALACYNARDDWQDEGKPSAKILSWIFGRKESEISQEYPRQCAAITQCIQRLSELEKANCPSPDECANCFGQLLAELMVYREDLWSHTLRQVGFHLGRFIYLADAAMDYREDKKHKKYNPFLAMGMEENFEKWSEYLVLAMGRCSDAYERLPLVQDKGLLDNILYSGVWLNYRNRQRELKKEDPNG